MRTRQPQQGFALIEVLVTILVLVVGLLGMFALLSRSTVLEAESYQRSQALTLIREMEGRLRANFPLFDANFRANHAAWDNPAVFGQGSTVCSSNPAGGALREACAWNDALQGQFEREGSSTGTLRGAMVGARGCLMAAQAPQGLGMAEYFIVVVWQGLNRSADPDAGTPAATCARDVDFGAGQRRALVLRVLVPVTRPGKWFSEGEASRPLPWPVLSISTAERKPFSLGGGTASRSWRSRRHL